MGRLEWGGVGVGFSKHVPGLGILYQLDSFMSAKERHQNSIVENSHQVMHDPLPMHLLNYHKKISLDINY